MLRGAIVGGTEVDATGAVPTRVAVDESAVAEALGTALFVTRSTARELQFAHQSFGEFLAADWLSRLDFTRIASLLCLPGDADRRIIPQLQGVAAWAAALNADVFAHVLAVDADLLLRPSMARVAPEQRREVVDALLDLAEQGHLDFSGQSVRRALADLVHPGLADQLLDALGDASGHWRARELACEIAADCNMTVLEDALLDVALDTAAPVRLRTSAVLAFDDVASDEPSRSRLIELATADLDLEGADELKGAALRAVWPKAMTAEQLFAAITPPKAPEVLGLYTAFMADELVDGLGDDDLALALRWAADHYDPYGLGRLELLALRILARAWSQIDDPAIAGQITEMVRAQLMAHLILLQPTAVDTNDLFVAAPGRRKLVCRLVPALRRGELDATSLVNSEPALVLRGDLPWVLEQLTASLGTEEERAWATVANQLWAYQDDEAVALIWEVMDYSQQLAEVAADRFAPIPLDSELAENNRQWYERQQRIQAERAAREAEQEAWTSALARRLSDAVADPQTAWPQLSALLTGERHDALVREAEQRVVDSPGFALTDPATRQTLIDRAEHYLVTADLAPDDWLGSGEIPQRAVSAVRALDLLLIEAPDRLESLAPDVWSRAVPSLVAHPSSPGTKGEASRELRLRANAIDPARVARALTRIVIGEDRRNGRAWQLEHADELGSNELEAKLTETLEHGDLRPDSAADIVAYGLRANYASIRRWAVGQVDRVPGISWAQLEHVVALRVAVRLIQGTADAAWSSIWRAMQHSALWGCELAAAVVEIDVPRLDRALDESELAELFCWLQDHFPAQEDPRAHVVNQRTRIAWWRDSLLNALVHTATDAGIQALGAIRDRYPALDGLSTFVVRASDAHRAAAWRPPTPTAVVELGLHHDRRLVANDLDLLRVVLEALERIQQRLRPPNPAAADLWDTAVRKPKAEDDISDWLQRQLQDEFQRRLIIIDREVQVSRLPGGGVGERTDLLIQAAAGDDLNDAEMVALVIEVKGCWNPRLSREMREQLADRYLDPHARRCGIYLIAWFGRGNWADGDYRRRSCGSDKDLVEKTYQQQARDLSAARELAVQSVVLDGSLPERR